ncbi:hypothetical protein BOTBODRAFT_422805 [Botryobasidium botryosum FD-172 SS1]|uniref:Uncharacterized protein n=1 Tax=Botryobasidium botryosum (strain FD-172 SS1) TaxID=930990 RepID=A0A067MCG4_BOTB1|nr:hypothetical protein BOTBODRAFT_422805 [Botryobasidium botryosum FD-172 SS1]
MVGDDRPWMVSSTISYRGPCGGLCVSLGQVFWTCVLLFEASSQPDAIEPRRGTWLQASLGTISWSYLPLSMIGANEALIRILRFS